VKANKILNKIEYHNTMRSSPVKTALSFDEFLEFEIQSLERHEFVDGNLFVMAGGTDRQNHICIELVGALKPAARAVGLRTYMGDVLICTPNDVGYYPDVYVTRDNPNDTSRVKREPVIIFEVLSESTEMFELSEHSKPRAVRFAFSNHPICRNLLEEQRWFLALSKLFWRCAAALLEPWF
jgi:Putative restriction endonuclease